ncbi:MAG: hypothetical protein M3O46_19405, partial [Myxococcota bacterium]|nr:hypothetical protein [Myxococcota bacterium]
MPSLREAAFPFLVLFAVGCSSAPDPQNVPAAPEAGVTNGVSNQVSVALASTHLGAEGCTHDESGGLKVMACASLPDGSPRGTGLCGGPCEYSSVQLSFASRSGSAAHIQITKVALVDAATGMDLQALTAYTPLVWNGTQYTPWDETIAASSQIKTSYTL